MAFAHGGTWYNITRNIRLRVNSKCWPSRHPSASREQTKAHLGFLECLWCERKTHTSTLLKHQAKKRCETPWKVESRGYFEEGESLGSKSVGLSLGLSLLGLIGCFSGRRGDGMPSGNCTWCVPLAGCPWNQDFKQWVFLVVKWALLGERCEQDWSVFIVCSAVSERPRGWSSGWCQG